jgi:hypothetical protein
MKKGGPKESSETPEMEAKSHPKGFLKKALAKKGGSKKVAK